MRPGTRTLVSALAMCVYSTTLPAQISRSADQNGSSQPVVGRYIGNVPKHQREAHRAFSKQTRTAAGNSKKAESSVVRTGAEHDIPAEAPAPEAFPLGWETVPGGELMDNGALTCQGCSDPTCCQPSQIWGRGEYLLWWTKGMAVPPLVTTSPDNTPQDQAGVLGQVGTDTLFGDQRFNNDARSGARFTVGRWLDDFNQTGIDLSYLFLGRETTSFAGSSDTSTILARPFLNVQSGQQDARLIAFPNLVSGTLSVGAVTEFQAAEVLMRRTGEQTGTTSFDYYLGYRFADLDDRLTFVEATNSLAGPTQGSTINLNEHFDTNNRFHGGQLGVRFLHQPEASWSLEILGKFAVGGTNSRANIFGQTTTTTAGGDTTTANGGLLAQGTNRGSFEDDQFSTITEVGLAFRRRSRCGWTTSIGYSFLYWSDVARAGDQIDVGVNPTQIPPGTLSGESRPAFQFEKSDFWAQGLNFGLEYLY